MITRRSLFASLAGLAAVPAVPSLAEQAKDVASVQFPEIEGPLGTTLGEWLHRKRVVEAFKGQWPQWSDMGRGLWYFKLHEPDKRTLIYDELDGVSRTVDNIYWGKITDAEWLDFSSAESDKGA